MFILVNFAVLLTILTVHVQADMKERFKHALESPEGKKCLESSGFDPETAMHEITPQKLCFLYCMMKEKGLVNDDGDVKQDAIDQAPFHIPEDQKEDIKQCIINAGKVENCEDVSKLLDCMPKRS